MKAVRLVLAASLVSTLAACGSSSSALSDAIGKGFDPKAKGVKYITVFESVPENGTMQLSANNKVQTLKKGDNLDTAFLKRDKISYYDYVGKIILWFTNKTIRLSLPNISSRKPILPTTTS